MPHLVGNQAEQDKSSFVFPETCRDIYAAFSQFFTKGGKITKFKQAHNKEFLAAGEVCTLINISCITYKRKGLFHKIRSLFLQNKGTFFLFSKKGRGDTPASCPLVVRLLNHCKKGSEADPTSHRSTSLRGAFTTLPLLSISKTSYVFLQVSVLGPLAFLLHDDDMLLPVQSDNFTIWRFIPIPQWVGKCRD